MFAQSGWKVYPICFPSDDNLKSFNFFLVEQSNELILIDAGLNTSPCWDFFQQTLKEHGHGIDEITSIVLTHNHIDHVGLVNRILEHKHVPVYAHPLAIPRLKRDKDFLAMRIQFFKQLYAEMGCGQAGEEQVKRMQNIAREREKDRINGDIVAIGDGEAVAGLIPVETPGHSPDHFIYYDPHRRWIFGGDLLLGHISSNAIVEPDSEGKRMLTLVQYIDSLKKCLQLDAELVFPGHGDFITDFKGLILHRLKRIEEKAAKLLELIQKGIQTADHLARTYYQERYQQQFSLIMSEIIGHLDYLEWRGQVQKEKKDGVWRYYPAEANETDI